MAQDPAVVESDRRSKRIGPSLLGGGVALFLGLLVLAILALTGISGGDAGGLGQQPIILGICLAVSTTLGWRLGPIAVRGGWLRTVGSGVMFGIGWPPITTLVAYLAAAIDGSLRGVFQPGRAQASPAFLVFGVAYGVAIFWIIGAVYLVPLGVIWALGTHAAGRVANRRRSWPAGGGRKSVGAVVLAFLATGTLGGAAQTLTYSPWATHCLDLPGGAPSSAGFSPAGNLLAVTTRRDSTTRGIVYLLDWPSGRLLGQWPAWVDRAVAVAPDGQVFWSSADDASGTNGIQTARAGGQAGWFTTPNGGGLADLSWTTSGLRGIGTTLDEPGFLPFDGDHSAVISDASSDNNGTLWVSPDGSATAASTFFPGDAVEVTTPSGTVSIPTGPVQSIALTADHRRLVAAEADGGLDVIEIASGRSQRIMPGTQDFVALSDRGDIAWLTDEPFGPGRLCTSTLAGLGAG